MGACAGAARGESCAERLRQHLLAVLLCPEKSTVTNLICVGGGQQRDWSADYRLYSKERVDGDALFARVLQEVLAELPATSPLVVALDDTLVRKSGKQVAGASWRRDPLGPPFQTNLVRGQRYLQMSAAWPLDEGAARMVPVVFRHSPSAPKAPKDPDEQERVEHRESCRQMNLNAYALREMERLRSSVPAQRPIIYCGDGSYTNASIVANVPEGCTYIGRLRKDAKLHFLPEASEGKTTGRPRRYGKPAPTPEELRTDETVPWQEIPAFAAGKTHLFRIKTLSQVLWRKSGTRHVVRIVVIAALSYRLRKASRLLYRQPAFLLCTDPSLPLEELLQYYLWRWGIEVNFREEKTLLGAGEAHVRTEASNRHLPAVVVASYALLWTAALRMHRRAELPAGLQPPKWRHSRLQNPHSLPSTGDLLRTLRYEIWRHSIRPASFYHFTHPHPLHTKSHLSRPSLPAALLHAA